MPLTYQRPRGEQPTTLGQLGQQQTSTGLPAIGRTPTPGYSMTPGMGTGSITNPNATPTYGAPTITGNEPNATPIANIQHGGNGGLHRAGLGARGGIDWNAWNAQQQPQMDRDLAAFGQHFASDPFAAASVLASGSQNSSARDAAVAGKYFGGDMGAFKNWLQSNLQQAGTYSYDPASGSIYNHAGLVSGPGRAPAAGTLQRQANAPATPGAGAPAAPGTTSPGTTLGGLAGGGTDSPGYGVNVNDFLDPSMQFRMNEGMRALENSAAGRGSLMSGDTLRGITDYAQGLASTEYGNAWNRAANNRDFTYGVDAGDRAFDYNAQVGDRAFDYGRQRDLAQFGLQAAGQQQSSDNTLAGILAAIMQNGGQIAGTGTMGQGNAVTGGIGNIINYLLQQQVLGSIPRG